MPESILALGAGSSKDAVTNAVKNIDGITTISSNEQNPLAQDYKKNATTNETLIYKINSGNCFRGNNTLIRFEFENGKLFKAYITTQFANVDYYDMQDNFNALRNMLKASFENEKQTKKTSGILISNGYTFSNKRNKAKTELTYISGQEKKGIYLLQLSWVNEHNEGIETILY